ncbi:MAG: ribose-phosphate pyrophosphokinase [Chlamydiota bacterium]
MSNKNYMLFSGTSHPDLAEKIAQSIGITLSDVLIERFPDGEIGVQILDNVRGQNVFMIQTIAHHPNLYLMELLILADALKRASANQIIAVIPHYGYARQDRKEKGRVPITAKLVANILCTAGVSRVITMDLHTEQIQGFFDIPIDNLYARPILAAKIQALQIEDPVVVAPDIGSAKLARLLAKEIDADFALIDKRRESARKVEINQVIGEIANRNALIIDDICSTGGTLQNAALACSQAGAKRILAAVTHFLFDPDFLTTKAWGIEKILITDTIPPSQAIDRSRIEIVSIAELFGKVIHSMMDNQSVSSFFLPKVLIPS